MSRVPLKHGNVPLFVRSLIFFARAQFVTLPRCPDVTANYPIERNYGNSVRFLAKIPNGTAAESPCYSVFWNAINFCRLYTSINNLNMGPANRPAFCRQVPLSYAKCPSKNILQVGRSAAEKSISIKPLEIMQGWARSMDLRNRWIVRSINHAGLLLARSTNSLHHNHYKSLGRLTAAS